MDYKELKVFVTEEAERDLDKHIRYLFEEKNNNQAALNVLLDFEDTKKALSIVANSIQLCGNPKLRKLGYRRINYFKHNYFILFRVEEDKVFVEHIFHFLEDFENKMN